MPDPTPTDRAQARAVLEMCEDEVYELRLLGALTNFDELETRIVAAIAAARLEGAKAGLEAAADALDDMAGDLADRDVAVVALRALDPAACLKER